MASEIFWGQKKRLKKKNKKAAEAAEAADAKASDEDWTTGLSGFLPILDGITTASAVGYLRRKNGMIQSYHRFFLWTLDLDVSCLKMQKHDSRPLVDSSEMFFRTF